MFYHGLWLPRQNMTKHPFRMFSQKFWETQRFPADAPEKKKTNHCFSICYIYIMCVYV